MVKSFLDFKIFKVNFKPSGKTFFTDFSKVGLLLWIVFVIYSSCLSCCLVCSLQPWGYLLGKSWYHGCLVCDVFFCYCHFPMLCPVSGVVLDCIDS